MPTVRNSFQTFPRSPWENLIFGSPDAQTSPTGFTLNPQPRTGQGAFGMVPGPIGLPSPYADINPAGVSSVINAHIRGQLSPEEQAAIHDIGARFAVTSGMPGTNARPGSLAFNRTLRDYGLATGARQAQGLQEYNALVPGAAFQAGLAESNALNAAAPDPTQRASYAKQLFDQYLASLGQGGASRGYSGPAGGTGSFAAPPTFPSGAGFPNPVNAPVNPNLPSTVYAPPPVTVGLPYDMPPAPMIDPFANGYVSGPPPEDWEEGLF